MAGRPIHRHAQTRIGEGARLRRLSSTGWARARNGQSLSPCSTAKSLAGMMRQALSGPRSTIR
uniref:Uncharacterized protein n=1 Tax=uncultured bacterium A1Q1_fos_499 TaxID=1256578 RepID=L7VYG5_9BACT|nr:hypothetical protein [uncultured bacterium A1Q1_fos_499]